MRQPYRATGGGWPLTKRLLDGWEFSSWSEIKARSMSLFRELQGIPGVYDER